MRTRFRTLLLAGAALFAVPAAYAAVTDGNGVPAIIGQVVKIVWNGNDISAANPLPTTVASGAITANQGAPAAQTQANAWPVYAYQGTSPWAISGPVSASQSGSWSVGVTNPFALDATITARLGTLGQKAMAASTPVAIATDQSAVPIQGGNATAVKTDGSATTQPISAAALPLPTGAATAANQNATAAGTSAASAQAVQGVTGGVPLNAAVLNRSVIFADVLNASIAANGSSAAVAHDIGGTSSQWAKVNSFFLSSQSGTYTIQGSNDNFATAAPIVASGTLTANTATQVPLPVLFRYYRAYITNGSTAATGVFVQMSFTAS